LNLILLSQLASTINSAKNEISIQRIFDEISQTFAVDQNSPSLEPTPAPEVRQSVKLAQLLSNPVTLEIFKVTTVFGTMTISRRLPLQDALLSSHNSEQLAFLLDVREYKVRETVDLDCSLLLSD